MSTTSSKSVVAMLLRSSFVIAIAIAIQLQAVSFAVEPTGKNRIDWTTMPSTYTHDGQGAQVDQYAQSVQPIAIERPDYQRSGYRQTRSTIQAGNSVDNYHTVDQWGPQVRPYGEWRYPNRPFAVPYGAWGPQLPLVNSVNNFGGVAGGFQGGGFGGGFAGRPQPGFGYGGPNQINPNAQFNANPQFNPNAQGGNFTGAFPYDPYQAGYGQSGFGQPGFGGNYQGGNPSYNSGGFGNGYGVGPNNALRPDQDDYYAPVPEMNPPTTDRDFFFVPGQR